MDASVTHIVSEMGDRRYETAIEEGRVWNTSHIEDALHQSPELAEISSNLECWRGFFSTFVGLAREACNGQDPQIPFIYFSHGLIPEGWSTSDVHQYIASENDLSPDGIRAGLAILESGIRQKINFAVESLGWFFAIKDGRLLLIGWPDLLEPTYGYIGTRSYIVPMLPSNNVLSEETRQFLERIALNAKEHKSK